jgi:iron complex outermembrane recepter protein
VAFVQVTAEWERADLALAGRVRRIGAPRRQPLSFRRRRHHHTVDVYAFVDIPGRDFGRPEINNMRLTFRVRNLTDRIYAAFSDPGYPDQVYLGDPRTYEVAAHFKW